MDQSNVVFNLNSIYDGTFKVTYRGVPAYRCPFDYLIYQMLIFEVKPDLVIEIGTNFGGSTLYLSDLLKLGNHYGVVHSIDITSKKTSAFSSLFLDTGNVYLFADGWQNYDIDLTKQYKKILVIDDGSHHYQDILGAWQKFSPLVLVGSYYIIEDGVIEDLGMSLKYNGGPLKAIREILPLDGWIVDRRFCDLFGKNATFNVDGYLKRVR
jgi:cephalosporin hydroxylase